MAQRKGYLGLLFVLFLNLFLIQSESRSLHHIKRQFPHIPKTNRKLQINKKLSSLNRYYSTFATAIEPPGISTSNDSPFCVNPPLTPLNPSTPTPLTPAPTIPTPSVPFIPTPTTPPSSTPIFPSPSIPIIPTPVVPSPSTPTPITPTPTIPTPLTPTPITPTPTTPIQPSYSPPPKITNSPPPKGTSSPPTFSPGPPIFLPPIIYPPPLAPPSPKAKQNLWCVAKPAVPDPIIQEAMDYACGSGAECDPIKSSGSCFEPDTVISHASYAFNSYFQDLKETGATCDFGGAAVLVTEDPSYNGCHFKLA